MCHRRFTTFEISVLPRHFADSAVHVVALTTAEMERLAQLGETLVRHVREVLAEVT